MTMQMIPLTLIVRNTDQPRKRFDDDALDDLANSILENGLAQPITVRPTEAGFMEIVMGERRFRAHQRLFMRGHTQFGQIACHVRAMDEQTRDIQAILENLQRVDVSPLEEAQAFKRMLDMGMEIDDLAKKVGRPKWRIEERIRLMGLDPSIFKLCEIGQFDHHVAQVVALLPSHADQKELTRLWNSGTIVGFKALRAAVAAKAEGLTQVDIFGADAFTDPGKCVAIKAAAEDLATINRMEMRIETISGLAAAGFSNGACVIATKVSRDRTRLMADRIKAIRSALVIMEGALRAAAAQAEMVLAA